MLPHLGQTCQRKASLQFFQRNCCCHSLVLSLKPVAQQYERLPSTIVRTGHLHQSSRGAKRIDEALTLICKRDFKWKKVLGYPPTFREWQAKARAILERSVVAGDLTAEQITFVLAMDNGDWECLELIRLVYPWLPLWED